MYHNNLSSFFLCCRNFRVLYNIMGNDFVGEEYKARLRKSAKIGRDGAIDKKNNHKKSCATEFPCLQLDSRNNNRIPGLAPKVETTKQVRRQKTYRVKSVKND